MQGHFAPHWGQPSGLDGPLGYHTAEGPTRDPTAPVLEVGGEARELGLEKRPMVCYTNLAASKERQNERIPSPERAGGAAHLTFAP